MKYGKRKSGFGVTRDDMEGRNADTARSPRRSAFAADEPADEAEEKTARLGPGKIIGRIFLCLGTFLLYVVLAAAVLAKVLVSSGCEPLKVKLVLSATQASAVKWLPGLFMPQSEVDKIVENSLVVSTDVMSLEEYAALAESSADGETEADEWANARDGMIFETINGSTFTGYILIVKDPSRVFVGTASDFTQGLAGMKIFDIVKKENAVAAINAGEFADPGGRGAGNNPMGITFSRGKMVWNDGLRRTFLGFDKNDRFIVRESMTKAEAESLGIRDGVSFQNGNTLITSEDGNITLNYADSNTGTAQRTAIGQRADGAVILLVTDGRSASSLGATRNDIIDVMVRYGAVTAGMLDGGSSSLMYYEDYYDKYGFDAEKLDEYQKMGLVNKYKAFTTPRRMPTFICVAKEASESTEGTAE